VEESPGMASESFDVGWTIGGEGRGGIRGESCSGGKSGGSLFLLRSSSCPGFETCTDLEGGKGENEDEC
jgi:hypothetical protein